MTIDDVKTFWNRRPCNIGHSKKPLYTKEYFDEVEQKKLFVEPHIVSFSNFPEWKGKEVLEIGCGLGTTAVNFARAGANYTAVELSEVSLEATKKRFEIYGLKGNFYTGNAEHLSDFLPLKTYDLIYSFGVIHHSPEPEKIVSKLRKYMSSESILKIMLYAQNSWKKIMIDSGFDQFEAQSGCPFAFTYDYESVTNLLKGFHITGFKQTHIFPYIVEEYKKNNYVMEPWFQAMGTDMFKALEQHLGWHLLITAKLQ